MTPHDPLASLIAAWLELKAHLELRCRELSDEIRSYPTPIARCDEQLTGLIERRARAIEHLKRFIDSDPRQPGKPEPDWRARLESYLAESRQYVGDEAERAIRVRLEGALREAGAPIVR